MTSNLSNRRRAFAEAVTIDTWHSPFSAEACNADLFADVVFGTARVGGEAESPVRFRLRIRRADVVVVIPPSEAVSVDKQSVSRDAPELQAHLTRTVQQSTKLSAKAGASAVISGTGIGGQIGAGADAEKSLISDSKIEITGKIAVMGVTQSKTPEGFYRWSIEPSAGGHLEGRPWDSAKPRLQLLDQRKNRLDGIPPTVRVEVHCRREDIEIEEITLKDESLFEKMKSQFGARNRLIAAEAYIRDQLTKEGLEVTNVSDIFGRLTLASTTAEEGMK